MTMCRLLWPSIFVLLLSCGAFSMPPRDNGQTETEKRSQEDIMFGNQQNKPAGMMDDLIVFPDRKSDPSAATGNTVEDKNGTQQSNENDWSTQAPSSEEAATSATALKASEQELPRDTEEGTEQGTHNRFDYYDYLDDGNSVTSRELPPPQENTGGMDYSMYDYSDGLFRRKRTLRNSLDELLSSRRLHRRALRYKRDANMDDLLYFLTQITKSDPRYAYLMDEEPQSVLRGGSSEPSEAQLEQYLGELSDMSREDRARTLSTLAAAAALAQQEPHQSARAPTADDFREDVPEWFQVSRRSQAPFYPQDYRFLVMPSATQKRSDRWGRILQKRRQPPQDDTADISRLYTLAGLLAEPEDAWA
ncbi:uncharacterized protein LOC135400724 isoform X2 [Ornithodoros turicata]|uniref:uncharacterized protein LOC135400724 isoform X2 n=1 Tax=Ornithodoros turicata TaxID=34597 RepID=UPI00313A18FD